VIFFVEIELSYWTYFIFVLVL